MKSTITFTSILLGFLGTLLTQLLITKRENEKSNKVYFLSWYLTGENKKIFNSRICATIYSGIILIILSILQLSNDVFCVLEDDVKGKTKTFLWYAWLLILVFYLLYQTGMYKLFVDLLINNEEKKQPQVVLTSTEEEDNEFLKRLAEKNNSSENTNNTKPT